MYWATGLPGRLRSGRYFDREEKIDPDFEKQSLKDQESILQSELDTIKKRLGELETPDQNAWSIQTVFSPRTDMSLAHPVAHENDFIRRYVLNPEQWTER